jgi:Arc/MetJ-type ribon-helix-helix transcriptional regulator
MSTHLSPENEALLAEAVSSGAFASPEMALDEALRLLRRKLEIEEELIAGLDSGEAVEVADAYWARKRSELRRRHGAPDNS